MDRGMIKEDGIPIESFRNEYLCKMPYILPVIQEDAPIHLTCQAMDMLFSLETVWLQGLRSFAETVLTSMICHRPDYIENEPLRIYVLATLRACQIVEMQVRLAGTVVSPEEFYRSTFSVLPEPDEPEEDELSARQLINALAELEHKYREYTELRLRLTRIRVWLKTLDQLHYRNSIGSLSKDIEELQNLNLTIEPIDDEFFQREQLAIFPSLANIFLIGCPRVEERIVFYNPVDPFKNLAGSLTIILDCVEKPFNQLLELLYRRNDQLHPITGSLLHNALHKIPALMQTNVLLEETVVKWLGQSQFTRINLQPIAPILLDSLQIGCNSPCERHYNLHRLLRHIQQYLNRPDLQKNLYCLDYLRWLRCLLAIEAILLGFQLEIYEDDLEWPEAFWALSHLFSIIGDHKRERLAMVQARFRLRVDMNIYGDCRFSHRWNHLLTFMDDPLHDWNTFQLEDSTPSQENVMPLTTSDIIEMFRPDWNQKGFNDNGKLLPCRYIR